MKKVIQILILLLTTVDGFSKCSSGGLDFWPSSQTINENSVFVIDGYATSQKIITGLGTTYKVYLKSDGQVVNLKVQETLVGQFSLTQAILRPETKLTTGTTYELIIDNLPEYQEVYRYNSSTNYKKEKVKWTVVAAQDTVAPAWAMTPKFTEGSYQMYGCGPAVNAFFSYSAIDNSEILIKTVVKNLSTGLETTYYLKPDSNTIAVGHSMCSGAFTFDNSDVFEVEFSLFDESGNITTWTGDKIKFKRPT